MACSALQAKMVHIAFGLHTLLCSGEAAGLQAPVESRLALAEQLRWGASCRAAAWVGTYSCRAGLPGWLLGITTAPTAPRSPLVTHAHA
jgi:hypothetical protein